MSTTAPPNDFLLESAKRQLGFKPNAQDYVVSVEYLKELKKHLAAYPDEVNFTIQRQPKSGYGYITCLREGCNRKAIALESSKDAVDRDGGITRGFGAFTSYQWHIRIAHLHKPKQEPFLPAIKVEPQPLAIKTEHNPPVIKPESRRLMIKHEPVEDPFPSRKRSGSLSIHREVAPKKIKADPELPLTARLDIKPPPLMKTETTLDELANLETKINHLQPQLDQSRRNSGKTTEQLTRERDITSQLIALYRRKKELTEMIPAVFAPACPFDGPSYQNGLASTSAQPRQPIAPVQPPVPAVPVPSGSNLPLNFFKDEPMDADSDSDDPTALDTSDIDHFHPFGEQDTIPVITDGTISGADLGAGLGVDFYHYNTAKSEDIKRYLEIAGSSDYFDGDAKVEASLKALGLPNLSTLLPGMEVALMPHQVIGVDWMIRQEACQTLRGGILADEMGLGKTIQTLAVIVANRPADNRRHQTLVVAPLALLDQWQIEIEMKTDRRLKCHVHHG